jgi:hypothetical protein
MGSGTLVWTALVFGRVLVVFGVGCDAVWRLLTSSLFLARDEAK